MAKCDEGYNCAVCRQPVDTLPESLLYLRYLLGEVSVGALGQHPECHIRCCPEMAQHIVHPDFAPVACEGPFARANFDAGYRDAEEMRITAAWAVMHEAGAKGFSLLAFVNGTR